MQQFQKINIFEPIMADKVGPPPVVINALITPSNVSFVGAVPANSQRVEKYVLLSALPEELRRRVELAIQVVSSAM
jgi:hypothetical protein